MAKKRSRQSREAEWVTARQQGRRDNQLANKRQREGRRTRGKREGRRQRTRGGGAPRGQEAAAARREASRQPAGGASGASSSSSASFPPCRDCGALREIPSYGVGSDVSRIVTPLALLPSLPPSDAWRALLAAVAPATTVLIAMGAGPRQTRGKRQAEAVAEVVNDPATETGAAAAAATVAAAGNRGGK